MESMPGFTLYNMTDGIKGVDVTGWFCRWLLSQHLTWKFDIIPYPSRQRETSL